jgi:predicted RNA-binding Zn-ribbon protein involved in translation (DUF1610 family)
MENMFMLMTCKRCGKKTIMKNMRYDKDGSSMICIDCLNKEVQLRDPKTLPTHSEPKKAAKKEAVTKWYCQDCKYHFERKTTAQVSKCPYCGKAGYLMPETKLASDKIIEESIDNRYDTPDSFLKRR